MVTTGANELEQEDKLDIFVIHHKHTTHERLSR